MLTRHGSSRILGWSESFNGVWLDYTPSKDEVGWTVRALFDQNTYEDHWYRGAYTGQGWLEILGACWQSLRDGLNNGPKGNCDTWDALGWLQYYRAKLELSRAFLDSFSIIERGETSRRTERRVTASSTTKALVSIISSGARDLRSLSPRELEVLVAATLVELGLDFVRLRRYSMDDGYDILAVVAEGEIEETILVEVKHYHGTVGIAALDRLNGVRQRLSADRCLLVASTHVSSYAKNRYAAMTNVVSARSYNELTDLLSGSSTWDQTKRGLWTCSAHEPTT